MRNMCRRGWAMAICFEGWGERRQRKRDATLEAQALHCFALFKQERGHLREARRSLELLVRFYRKVNDLAALVEVYRTLGVINQHQGDLKLALEYFDKAETLIAATNREDLFADVYVA